jgi:hypothetical protein
MRNEALLEAPARLAPSDHAAWWFDGPEEFDRLAAAFVSRGRELGHRLLYCVDDPSLDRLRALPDATSLIAEGTLQVSSVAEIYGADRIFDPAAVLRTMESTLQDALADGYAGCSVVADNTSLAQCGPDEMARWDEWEVMADRFIAAHPVVGLCAFDGQVLKDVRSSEMAVQHPVVNRDLRPAFRLFFDGPVLKLTGSCEVFDCDQLARILRGLPAHAEVVIDLGCADFVCHNALLLLAGQASPERPITAVNAPSLVTRLWEVMDVTVPGFRLAG